MDIEKGIGTILKEARLAKELSFAQIEEKTNIRANYLEAIEKEDFAKIPGEVFTKGMIRTYGNFLGLEGDKLVSIYKAQRSGLSMEEVNASNGIIRETSNVKMNISLKQKRDWGTGNGFSLSSLKLPGKQIAMGLAAVALLGAMYFAVPKIVAMVSSVKEQPQTTAQVQKPEVKEEKTVINDKVEVAVEATGQCWTEAFADGKEAFVGMLSVGDKKLFIAKEKLSIKYGNIGAVRITVNGTPVDLQGEHGVAIKTYAVGQPLEATNGDKK